MKICPHCGAVADDRARFCSNCGQSFESSSSAESGQSRNAESHYGQYQQNYYSGQQEPYYTPYNERSNPFDEGPEGKSRGVAALLAILFGSIGVQYFYLGKVTAGLLSILLSMVTCGLWSVVALVQGILMFCMSNEEFRQKYVLSYSTFPLF